jgi:hypothetical protein
MKNLRSLTLLSSLAAALVVAVLAVPALAAAPGGVYADLVEHYQPVRDALLADTLDGVAGHAKAMAAAARDLHAGFSAEAAGVPAAQAAEVKAALPELARAADALAAAKDLAAARAAFGDLSEALVAWHEAVPGSELAVAYCPMAKASWLQPDGDVGNPYMGQKMAKCGKVVSR